MHWWHLSTKICTSSAAQCLTLLGSTFTSLCWPLRHGNHRTCASLCGGNSLCYCPYWWWWSSFPKPCSALCWDSLWKGQISGTNEVRSSCQIRDRRVLSQPHHKPVSSHESWCSCDIFFVCLFCFGSKH